MAKELDTTTKLTISKACRNLSYEELSYSEIFEEVNKKKKKYSNIDILTYLVYFIKEKLESESVDITTKTLENYMFLMKRSFLSMADKNGKLVFVESDFPLIKDMLSIKALYENFIMKNDGKINKDLVSVMSSLLKNEKFQKDLESSGQNNKDSLEDEVHQLKLQIQELEKQILVYDKQEKKDAKSLDKKNKKIEELNNKIKELNNKIKELNNEIKPLNKENEKLQKDIEDLTLEIESLKERLSKSEALKEKLKKQPSTEEIRSTIFNLIEETNKKQYILDSQIYDLILLNSLTVNQIKAALKEQFPDNRFSDIKIEDIKASLERLKGRFKILPDEIKIPMEYKISPLDMATKNRLTIPIKRKSSLNMMLISDMHIDNEVNKRILSQMDAIYNYCTAAGINYIFNLGDLLHVYDLNNGISILGAAAYSKVLEEIIKYFPKDDNISHIILGGNHDARGLSYGFDGLDYLATNREDIISLGYLDALVDFEKGSNREHIMLHHQGLPESIKDYDKVKYILNKVHNHPKLSEDDTVYFDFFGHLHKSEFDATLGYGAVPALVNSRFNESGAWHVKIDFDENGKIKDLLIYPLVFLNSKLKNTSELLYRRLK